MREVRARVEPRDHVGDVVEDAAGLGLDRDAHGAAGLAFEGGEALDQPLQVVVRGAVGRGIPPCSPPERERRDAPLAPVGEQGREGARAVQRVPQPLGRGPVGAVDRELDDIIVEPAVREGVHGPQLQTVVLEGVGENRPCLRVAGEGGCHAHRHPQSDAEAVEARRPPDRARVLVELADDAREVFGGVDVGAVRQLHPQAPWRDAMPRSTELPSNSSGPWFAGAKPSIGSVFTRPLCA